MRLGTLFIISGLLFAILLNSASALSSIEVTSPRYGDVYKIGDQVAITGQITLDENAAGTIVVFSAVSKKLNRTISVASKP